MTSEQFERKMGPCLSSVYTDELLLMISIDYYLAQQKLEDAQHAYNTMRFFLWKTTMPNESYHKVKVNDEHSILWHRQTYCNTAILWFNLCGDYLLQAIWLGLCLHGEKNITDDKYSKILVQCKYDKVVKALRKKESKILLPLIEEYFQNSHVKAIRGWTNHLKHKGAIESQEFDTGAFSAMGSVTINHSDGSQICDRDLARTTISTGDIVDNIVIASVIFLSTFASIEECFSSDNCFYKNEAGSIITEKGLKKFAI